MRVTIHAEHIHTHTQTLHEHIPEAQVPAEREKPTRLYRRWTSVLLRSAMSDYLWD